MDSISARINIKPLSVNRAWQGRRYKTQEYKRYEELVLLALPKKNRVTGKRITLNLEIGVSNRNADLDNACKCFLDCLQKKYGFNDRYVYKIIMEKEDVKKGREYISFKIADKK